MLDYNTKTQGNFFELKIIATIIEVPFNQLKNFCILISKQTWLKADILNTFVSLKLFINVTRTISLLYVNLYPLTHQPKWLKIIYTP